MVYGPEFYANYTKTGSYHKYVQGKSNAIAINKDVLFEF